VWNNPPLLGYIPFWTLSRLGTSIPCVAVEAPPHGHCDAMSVLALAPSQPFPGKSELVDRPDCRAASLTSVERSRSQPLAWFKNSLSDDSKCVPFIFGLLSLIRFIKPSVVRLLNSHTRRTGRGEPALRRHPAREWQHARFAHARQPGRGNELARNSRRASPREPTDALRLLWDLIMLSVACGVLS